MKQKLTETEHEAMGQRQRAEDHGKVIFASVFFFFLPSYIPHLSMHDGLLVLLHAMLAGKVLW